VLPFDDPGLRTLATQKPVSEKIENEKEEHEVSFALASLLNE